MNNPPTTMPRTRSWAPIIVIALAGAASTAGTLWLRGASDPTKPDIDMAVAANADLSRRGYRPLSDDLRQLLDESNYRTIATQAHPLLGLAAPDFSLSTVDGQQWRLSDRLKSGPVLLVFYYGYHCDHCVSQLFGLNKDIAKFRELNVEVVAVSADPAELTRDRYRQYGKFSYPVLSDAGNLVARDYGVYVPPKTSGESGDLLHGSFVINSQGKIVWANRGDGPFTENRTLLIELNKARGEP